MAFSALLIQYTAIQYVTLVSRYPFLTAAIDHNMDVNYKVKHRLHMPWTPIVANNARLL